MKSSCCHSDLILTENNRCICVNEQCKNYLGGLTVQPETRTWNNLFACFFFAFIFLFTFNDYSYNKNPLSDCSDVLLKIKQNQPINDFNLKAELKNQDIVCRDEVFAQLLLESAHMGSFLFLRTNNLCGMRYPAKRNTSAIGIYLPGSDTIIRGTQDELKKYSRLNNYAVYSCWQDCIKDYKLWQDQCFKVREKYLSFLGANYAEDLSYVKKIRTIAK